MQIYSSYPNHDDRPSYENWAYGEPEAGQNKYDQQGGAACGAVNPGAEQVTGEWTADNCVQRKNYVCQKLTGNACPKDWTYLQSSKRGKCYKFVLNGRDHVPWYDSFQAGDFFNTKFF